MVKLWLVLFECKGNSLGLLHVAYGGVEEVKAESGHCMQAQW